MRKKALASLLAIAVLSLSIPARGSQALLTAATATTSSAWIRVPPGSKVGVYIWSASTSNATVIIETANDPLEPADTAITVTNPSSSAKGFIGYGIAWFRVTISAYASGSITATAEFR